MKPDGGPAFPCGHAPTMDLPARDPLYYSMSVRTLVAALVMAGCAADPEGDFASPATVSYIVRAADALIAELAKADDWEADQLAREKAASRAGEAIE